MTVNNFIFRERWVGSEVTGMKATFLPFSAQTESRFWPQNAQIWNCLKNILKNERQKDKL